MELDKSKLDFIMEIVTMKFGYILTTTKMKKENLCIKQYTIIDTFKIHKRVKRKENGIVENNSVTRRNCGGRIGPTKNRFCQTSLKSFFQTTHNMAHIWSISPF